MRGEEEGAVGAWGRQGAGAWGSGGLEEGPARHGEPALLRGAHQEHAGQADMSDLPVPTRASNTNVLAEPFSILWKNLGLKFTLLYRKFCCRHLVFLYFFILVVVLYGIYY